LECGTARRPAPTAAALRGAEKVLVCPYCQNDNVFAQSVEIRDRAAEVILKKPSIDLPRFLGWIQNTVRSLVLPVKIVGMSFLC
jgi:hypothetical protein